MDSIPLSFANDVKNLMDNSGPLNRVESDTWHTQIQTGSSSLFLEFVKDGNFHGFQLDKAYIPLAKEDFAKNACSVSNIIVRKREKLEINEGHRLDESIVTRKLLSSNLKVTLLLEKSVDVVPAGILKILQAVPGLTKTEAHMANPFDVLAATEKSLCHFTAFKLNLTQELLNSLLEWFADMNFKQLVVDLHMESVISMSDFVEAVGEKLVELKHKKFVMNVTLEHLNLACGFISDNV
ncbi:hypothetical protein L596_022320 [Steinernema carpocapsae]|uniref:Uncharacterized protein n=1 Tax=Steinernema carpocapsae TaxID=34508 RepID=A0A4U5MLC5_STECR|nr:hypothetical protein L596_022320 [Steinernema carpocapsae]